MKERYRDCRDTWDGWLTRQREAHGVDDKIEFPEGHLPLVDAEPCPVQMNTFPPRQHALVTGGSGVSHEEVRPLTCYTFRGHDPTCPHFSGGDISMTLPHVLGSEDISLFKEVGGQYWASLITPAETCPVTLTSSPREALTAARLAVTILYVFFSPAEIQA